jgi:hypothetical protein
VPSAAEQPDDEAVARLGRMLSHPIRVYVLREVMERGEAEPKELVEEAAQRSVSSASTFARWPTLGR